MSGLFTARALYFCYYMALGSFLPFLGLYYERSGLSGVQIGTLSALSVLVSSPAAFFWGGVADRLKIHRRMLILSVMAAPVCVWFIGRTTSFGLFVPIIVAYALCAAPITPLLDGSALDLARVLGRTYGEVRVGGNIGWIVSVVLVGLLMQAYGIHWMFYSYVACMALMLIFSLFQTRQTQSLELPWSANVRVLLSDPSVIIFFISSFIVMLGNGAVQSFYSIYLNGIGGSEGTIGIAWAVASFSEIPVMMFAGRLMRRIGSGGMLMVAFFMYALRWLLLSFISDPALAVAAQLMSGLSFAAYLTAGVTYLNQRTPEGLTTTAQSIFNGVAYGLASLTGSMAGGFLYDHSSMPVFFRIFSLTTLVGLGVFWFSSTYPWKPAYRAGIS